MICGMKTEENIIHAVSVWMRKRQMEIFILQIMETVIIMI